jgi:hypothetical protein
MRQGMNKVSEEYLRDLLREIVSLRANNCCEYPGCKNTECDPLRTIEWLQEVIERKNQIITVPTEIYREECKEKLMAELTRLGSRGWRP